jgi:oligopeptide transport system permease protein
MARYLASRLLESIVTLFFIALTTFLLMHAVPGGPFESIAGERGVSPEFVAAQEAYYGLDDPIPVQFVRYLGNLARGDLGISFDQRGQHVTDLIKDKFKPSLILGTMSFLIVIGVGVPVGVISAARRNTISDYAALIGSTALAAVPSFVLAFILLLVFSVGLEWFPVRLGKGFGDSWASLGNGILPALALGAPSMALLSRLTRGAMLEVLDQDYVRTARAKGLANRTVYWRHALRNALIPVLTLMGPLFTVLVTGSIIIESIFGLPGIGAAFISSVLARDYGMIMGTTMLFATIIVFANLLVDLAYPLVDPRVRVT